MNGVTSVIIPFLDAEPFLAEAIDSVLAQTCGDWQLILVDDGSSDGSTSIAERYVARHSDRMQLLRHSSGLRQGVCAARNLGLQHAAGEFVAFLDADDVWLPHKLERQREVLREQPEACMVYGPTLLWYGWTGDPAAYPDGLRPIGVPTNRLYAPAALLPPFVTGRAVPPAMGGFLVRRAALHAVGGFDVSFNEMFEDQALLCKLCLHGAVYVTDECVDWYRQHPGSASAAAQRLGVYDTTGPNPSHLGFLHWLEAYLNRQGAMDPKIRRALRRAFWPYRHPRAAWLVRRLAGGRDRIGRWLRPIR